MATTMSTGVVATATPLHQHHRPSKFEAYIIPQSGDEVLISSLESVETGRVLMYHQTQDKYEIYLDSSNNSTPSKPSMAILLGRNAFKVVTQHQRQQHSSKLPAFHILLPCQVEREWHLTLLVRCLQSILGQTDCHHLNVLMSVCGGTSSDRNNKYLERTIHTVRSILSSSSKKPGGSTWYLVTTAATQNNVGGGRTIVNTTKQQQLEILHEISHHMNPQAWILFCHSSDLFHPNRIHHFRLTRRKLLKEEQGTTTSDMMPVFRVPAKLIIMNEQYMKDYGKGKLEDFLNYEQPHQHQDIDKWKTAAGVVVSSSSSSEEDRLSDYCIPSIILGQLLATTPSSFTWNYCERRFCTMLNQLLCNQKSLLLPPTEPWLLIHYYNNSQGRRSIRDSYTIRDLLTGDYVLSDPSKVDIAVKPFDATTVKQRRFRKMHPKQVSVCRECVELLVVEQFGWNDDNDAGLEYARLSTCREVDLCHGRGLGNLIWNHVERNVVLVAFSGNYRTANNVWRKRLGKEAMLSNSSKRKGLLYLVNEDFGSIVVQVAILLLCCGLGIMNLDLKPILG